MPKVDCVAVPANTSFDYSTNLPDVSQKLLASEAAVQEAVFNQRRLRQDAIQWLVSNGYTEFLKIDEKYLHRATRIR